MALNIRYEKDRLEVVAGYESGHTMVFAQEKPGTQWQKLYSAQPHSQPGISALELFNRETAKTT